MRARRSVQPTDASGTQSAALAGIAGSSLEGAGRRGRICEIRLEFPDKNTRTDHEIAYACRSRIATVESLRHPYLLECFQWALDGKRRAADSRSARQPAGGPRHRLRLEPPPQGYSARSSLLLARHGLLRRARRNSRVLAKQPASACFVLLGARPTARESCA